MTDLSTNKSFQKLLPVAERSDALLTSFPKSGRTWVRFVMQHYVEQRYAVPFDIKSRTVDGFGRFPNIFFTEDYFDFFPDDPGEPYIVFRDLLRERALIALVRDPRDTLISLFHWTVLHRQVVDMPLRDFALSATYGIERMSTFVLALLNEYEAHPGPKHLLSYERCWQDPYGEFTALLKFLDGDQFDPGVANTAVEKSQFDAMQSLEKKISEEGRVQEYLRLGVQNWDGNVNALKVRKGGIGNYRQEAPWLDEKKFPSTDKLIRHLDFMQRDPGPFMKAADSVG